MIFACRGYDEINLEDLSCWDEWVELINEDYKYCKSIENVFEYGVKCDRLPSHHPYWSYVCKRDLFYLIEQTRGLMSQTKMYIDNGGHHSYNAKKSIELQKESIKLYLSKITK
jgi:hypothetical protein